MSRKIEPFSTRYISDNTISNKVCSSLLNSMTESETKHNHNYVK